MSRKVNLAFTLTGRCDIWRRNLKDIPPDWSNKDTLELTKSIITDYFGNSGMSLYEETLTNNAVCYPKYFCTGQFVGIDKPERQLILTAHGETMESARKSLLDAVSMIDWDEISVEI